MAIAPWLMLRQAYDLLRTGRPDDAHRALAPLLADGHRKAWKLSRDVAAGYAARGEKLLRADDPEAAWKELLAAESLNTGDARVADLRTALARIGVAECRAAVEAGNPLHAIETAARLRDRNARHPELSAVEHAAQEWVLAAEMADRGDFLLAKNALDRLRPRLSVPPAGLDRFVKELDARHDTFRAAVGRLADAADASDWRTAARVADEVVAVAPANRDARNAQLRSWEAVSPNDTKHYIPETPADRPHSTSKPGPASAFLSGSPFPAGGLPKRFLLWIDGVGGYLVCLAPRVTFGQATSDGPIDVPLFADVSRLHAELSRDGEGYVFASARGAQVNGTAVEQAVLKCGDRVTLGPTCQFLFRQPVPVSPSARLELVSGHRLPLAVDGILLMAENLILGPAGTAAHVCLPGVPSAVVLYRSKDGLGVRFDGSFTVDNSPCRERANVPLPGVVSAKQFTFAVEPVGPRL